MVAYKVATRDALKGGEWTSFATWLIISGYIAKYRLDEVTYPTVPGSRLFAFSSLEVAGT